MQQILSWLSIVGGQARPLANLVRRPWLRTFIWAAAAALVVWFYGDSLQLGHWRPFDGDRVRLAAVIAIFAAWACWAVVQAVRARSRNRAAIQALTADDGKRSPDEASQTEIGQLRGRLQEALTQLRKTAGNRRGYIYSLPWYVIIGPPGSGKTTALLNSGLRFPLPGKAGAEPVRGVGGTRDCDWWFTEDAILLDTAGRYTTQDSDPEVDGRAWRGFLGLLKAYRPLQPVNGVIVALSLQDMLSRDPKERLAQAQSIRQRIGELSEAFGSRFPIYVVLTKADLVAGFVQFFDAYNRSDCEQVWGITFPLDDGKPGTASTMPTWGAEFDGLLGRLNAIVIERMQQETDVERRGLIYGFPMQMATLKEPVREVLGEIFAATRHERRPLLRGVYFVSGTQEGAPVDRLMHAAAVQFGMDAPRLPGFTGVHKSYFLTRLLDQVIFAEASLVSDDPRMHRRQRVVQLAAAACALLLVTGFLGAWGVAYVQNRKVVQEAEGQVTRYDQAVAGIPTDSVDDADFLRILPPLDMLRDNPSALRQSASLLTLHTGLDQTAKLESQYHRTYLRALNDLLLPRVLVHLQRRLRERARDGDYVFDALRVYLSLGGQGPLDGEFARKWMRAEWDALYPGPDNAATRAGLGEHFATLLGEPLAPVALDGQLVSEARSAIRQRPLALRAYQQIRDGAAAQALPPWRPLDKAGAAADQAFSRLSGKPLTDGIPGLFTRDSYFSVFLPSIAPAIRDVEGQSWIYGETGAAPALEANLSPEIQRLYRAEFNTQWRTLLADLRIVPPATVSQAVLVLNALSGPASVLKRLLQAAAHDSDLALPAPDDKDAEAQQIRALVTASGPDPAVAGDPLQPIRAMQQDQGGDPSQLSVLLRILDQLYQQLSRSNGSLPQASSLLQAEGGVNEANQALISETRRLPTPVSDWMAALAQNTTSISSGGARAQIGQIWSGSGEKFCEQATAKRFPFVRGSSRDMSLDDFTRLFGPGGVLDNFFQQNLKQFVNTARRPWQWQYANAAGIGSAALAQFERAQSIRDAFFGNSATPGFSYEVTPVTLDAQSLSVRLDIQGQTLTWTHGPVRPTTMRWPGTVDAGARVSMQPSAIGGAISQGGPWAPFRLFDAASITPEGRDSFTVAFQAGLHAASFEVRSGTVLNPFTLADLRAFRCPGTL